MENRPPLTGLMYDERWMEKLDNLKSSRRLRVEKGRFLKVSPNTHTHTHWKQLLMDEVCHRSNNESTKCKRHHAYTWRTYLTSAAQMFAMFEQHPWTKCSIYFCTSAFLNITIFTSASYGWVVILILIIFPSYHLVFHSYYTRHSSLTL